MQKKRGSQDVQESTRLKVVSYLKKKSGTQNQAAEISGVSLRSVNRIWAKYKIKGSRGLQSKKRGVQGGKKITGVEAAEVRRLVKDKMPDQLKLPFGLWTREAVQQLILKKYDIELSRWQVGRYFPKGCLWQKDWGYTPQKPISKAYEQNPKRVAQWLEKEYPAIKKKAIHNDINIAV